MKEINKNIDNTSTKRNTGILLLCFFFLSMISCTSVNITPGAKVNDQIKGENRIMKKSLALAVRENSILKDENLQYKNDNNGLNTRIKLLESEMISLKKKYDHDAALFNEKYENLNKKNMILEQESSTKIQELTSVNRAMEEKMTRDIAKLNEDIRNQEKLYNKERATAELSFSTKELEYQKQLAQLKNEMLTTTTEIESIKSKFAESENSLQSLKAELLKKEEINSELKKKIDMLVRTIEKKKEDSPEKVK